MFYQQFSFWGKSTPAAVAAISGDRTLAYGEALATVDEFARRLAAAGVRAGQHVRVPKADHVSALLCQFALDKLGAATCILQGKPPAWVDWVIVHEPGGDARTILLPKEWTTASRGGDDIVPHEWKPNEPCRLKSSSGSTGRVKHICRAFGSTHEAGIVDQFMLSLRPGMRCAPLISWAGPAQALKTAAWVHGATLVVPDNTRPVLQQLADHRVSVLVASPANLQLLLARTPTPVRIPGMEIYLYGGRASPSFVETLGREVSEDIVMTYGATETGSVMMGRLRGRPVPESTAGYVVPPRRIEVIGDDGKPVPAGQRGRLRLYTTWMRYDGYYNAAGQRRTFDADDPDGFFPGDICIADPDGLVHVLGREDDVMNMGGRKLLASDLDNVLEKSGLVVEEAALNVMTASGSRSCVAAVPKPGVELRELRNALKKAFPGLLNVRIFRLAEMPRLANAKVDYQALRSAIARTLEEERGKEATA